MTVDTFNPQQDVISLTDAALAHFSSALKSRPDALVRLSTKESGCSGFAYELNIVNAAEQGDVVLTPNAEIRFAVASDALQLVKGTEIDMVTEGVNRVVKFNNPNVTAECGCGESFTVN